MNEIKNMEQFDSYLNENTSYTIYGAGWAGKIVCEFLQAHNIRVSGFAVTNLGKQRELKDLPVRSLDGALKFGRNIILAVTKLHESEMIRELVNRGIEDYFIISEAFLYEMRQYVMKINALTFQMHKKDENPAIGYLEPGYLDTNYAEERLIINKVAGATYYALPKELERIACVGTEYENNIPDYKIAVESCYNPGTDISNIDMIHTFNSVCKTNLPWCASFETILPRIFKQTESENERFQELLLELVKPNCLALFPISKSACKIQKRNLYEKVPMQMADLIMAKTKVLHPPQDVLIDNIQFEEKHDINIVHFIFIGNGFFFKGGREVIQALSRLEKNYDFKLTLISSLQYRDYFTETPYEEMVRCRKLIEKKSWIDYYSSLPNKFVLEKCKEAMVGLLPSVGDTYGYAVLEMQAAGCPVITTNIRAFPELNNELCGWICEVPLTESGTCVQMDMTKLSHILEDKLVKCFTEILENPKKIRQKGINSLERIRLMHDPYNYQKELRQCLNFAMTMRH